MQTATSVCPRCGDNVVTPAVAAPSLGLFRPLLYIVAGVSAFVIGAPLLAAFMQHASQPATLLPQHREAVARALADQALNEPHSITLSDAGFITAEYELDDAELRRLGTPVRSFAERRLLVIRAGLLPFGFRDYRVDVTGSPREAAVVTRYGAALLTESGLMRWVAP